MSAAALPLPFSAARRRAALLLLAAGLAFAPICSGVAMAEDGEGRSGSGAGGGGHGGSHSGGGPGGSAGSGRGGSDDGGGSGRDGSREDRSKGARAQGKGAAPRARLGDVVWSARREGAIEVRYADGWSESVDRSGYSLRDPGRRVVASRPAKSSDFSRLGALAE